MTADAAMVLGRPCASDARRAGEGWRIESRASLDAAAGIWRTLEAVGLATPYQTLAWQRAAFATLHADDRPWIIILSDPAGHPALLLPLVVRRRFGLLIASFAGGKHANANMPLMAPDCAARLQSEILLQLLSQAAKARGVDLLHLINQPVAWRGAPNPLAAAPHLPAAHSAWRADLIPDGETFLKAALSSEARKKLRNKERRLADLGSVRMAEAQSPQEAEAALSAFLAQKAARFAALGLADPFADPGVAAFLRAASVEPLAQGERPAVRLHALHVGEKIAAVFGGATHQGRYAGMFTSFDMSPEMARHSPGDVLLSHLVRAMCREGMTTFDLGVGDAAYKAGYCPIAEPMIETMLPVSPAGRLAALALAAKSRGKRAAMGYAPALRRLLGSLRRRSLAPQP